MKTWFHSQAFTGNEQINTIPFQGDWEGKSTFEIIGYTNLGGIYTHAFITKQEWIIKYQSP